MRYSVVDGQPGGALVLADGPRLEVDATGCVEVPPELDNHPMVVRMRRDSRLVESAALTLEVVEVPAEVEGSDEEPAGKSSTRRRKK